MYKFYATLLDSFQYYLHSENDTAMQEFIDKINRVPFESEAADKGTAFNELVDKILSDPEKISKLEKLEMEIIPYEFTNRLGTKYRFEFKKSVLSEFVSRLTGATAQVHTEAVLHTSRGDVLLYGYIDEVMAFDVTDIKTTGKYEFPKFLHNWQHRAYPYCLSEQGVNPETFTYRITDFNNYFEEVYSFDREKCRAELCLICERLIDFIELNRDKITDLKIFGEDEF